MKKRLSIVLLALWALTASADVPAGYYASLVGLSGESAIIAALSGIITNHTDVGYSGLYNVYPTSDLKGNNQVWDIYSTCTFTHGQKKCGSYSSVCDCYNREHTVPQSWFNEATPMKSDAFQVYPTDGKVNGQRGNYPYGECAGGSSLGGKALGRLGASTFPGYTSVGTVFEPDDQYKGDLARVYFYMLSCYTAKNFTQSSEGTKVFTYTGGKAGFTNYAKALFLQWSRQDSVSQKEQDRCDAVYSFQHNRNPFVDCKGLEEWIWGNKAGQTITQQDLVDCGCMAGLPSDLQAMAFPSLAVNAAEGAIRLACLPEGASVSVFSANGSLVLMQPASGTEMMLPLPEGFYLVLVSAQGEKQSFRVLVP